MGLVILGRAGLEPATRASRAPALPTELPSYVCLSTPSPSPGRFALMAEYSAPLALGAWGACQCRSRFEDVCPCGPVGNPGVEPGSLAAGDLQSPAVANCACHPEQNSRTRIRTWDLLINNQVPCQLGYPALARTSLRSPRHLFGPRALSPSVPGSFTLPESWFLGAVFLVSTFPFGPGLGCWVSRIPVKIPPSFRGVTASSGPSCRQLVAVTKSLACLSRCCGRFPTVAPRNVRCDFAPFEPGEGLLCPVFLRIKCPRLSEVP